MSELSFSTINQALSRGGFHPERFGFQHDDLSVWNLREPMPGPYIRFQLVLHLAELPNLHWKLVRNTAENSKMPEAYDDDDLYNGAIPTDEFASQLFTNIADSLEELSLFFAGSTPDATPESLSR